MLTAFLCLGTVAAADGAELADRFRQLSGSSQWRLVESIPLQFPTHHPQGMTKVGDLYYLSSVEVIDRSAGKGLGHLYEFDGTGKLLRQIALGEGAMYHPGGVDYDGRHIWAPVAEYRPDSRAIVYRIAPETLTPERIFEFGDHLGALAHDLHTSTLIGVSWGSRTYYRWSSDEGGAPVDAAKPHAQQNGSHYIAYQDCQVIPGTGMALFSGLNGYQGPGEARLSLGGIDLVDLRDLRPVHQAPVPLWTERGQAMTQNPFYVELRTLGLRVRFIPEDNHSTMYVYEVE